jgi:hypothetical protein
MNRKIPAFSIESILNHQDTSKSISLLCGTTDNGKSNNGFSCEDNSRSNGSGVVNNLSSASAILIVKTDDSDSGNRIESDTIGKGQRNHYGELESGGSAGYPNGIMTMMDIEGDSGGGGNKVESLCKTLLHSSNASTSAMHLRNSHFLHQDINTDTSASAASTHSMKKEPSDPDEDVDVEEGESSHINHSSNHFEEDDDGDASFEEDDGFDHHSPQYHDKNLSSRIHLNGHLTMIGGRNDLSRASATATTESDEQEHCTEEDGIEFRSRCILTLWASEDCECLATLLME